MNEQNIIKFDMKHHWKKGNQVCINEDPWVINGYALIVLYRFI